MDITELTGSDRDDLEAWYKERGSLPLDPEQFQPLPFDGRVSSEQIEAKIDQIAQSIEVNKNGFCSYCTAMFDSWPVLRRPPSRRSVVEQQSIHKDQALSSEHIAQAEDLDQSNADPTSSPNHIRRWSNFWGDVVKIPIRSDTISLEAATRGGCRSCAFFLHQIELLCPLSTCRAVERRLSNLGKEWHPYLELLKWGLPGLLYMASVGFPGAKDPAAMGMDQSKYILITRAQFEETEASIEFPMQRSACMALVRKWTSQCSNSHALCRASVQEYPSRLLSIDEPCLRLVSTEEWETRHPYATLSHCWGPRGCSIRLQKDNIAKLSTAILEDSLPATFRDAIEIAKAAGLAYLWIDSLCIVQDELADWETEASKMSSVYGGSSLTICASAARNPTEGCFVRTDNISGGFQAKVTIDGTTEILDFNVRDVYQLNVTEPHLASRGWAVQEKILSPRTLHCGKYGMFWECKSAVASEFFPNGHVPTHTYSFMMYQGECPEFTIAKPLPGRWKDIVSWYTSCDLTVPSDKLVAISGIARAAHKQTGHEYVAGLWRNTLVKDLVWVAKQPKQRPPYRAPSWSWAAVDGKCDIYEPVSRHSDETYVRVEQVDLRYSRDSFGAVLGGSMKVSCRGLLAGRVIGAEQTPRTTKLNIERRREGREVFVNLGHDKEDFRLKMDFLHGHSTSDWDSVYLLPIWAGKTGFHEHDDNDEIHMRGIVLQEKGSAKGVFERIGSFNFVHERRIDSYWHPVIQLLETEGKTCARAVCIEELDYGVDQWFTISIV